MYSNKGLGAVICLPIQPCLRPALWWKNSNFSKHEIYTEKIVRVIAFERYIPHIDICSGSLESTVQDCSKVQKQKNNNWNNAKEFEYYWLKELICITEVIIKQKLSERDL